MNTYIRSSICSEKLPRLPGAALWRGRDPRRGAETTAPHCCLPSAGAAQQLPSLAVLLLPFPRFLPCRRATTELLSACTETGMGKGKLGSAAAQRAAFLEACCFLGMCACMWQLRHCLSCPAAGRLVECCNIQKTLETVKSLHVPQTTLPENPGLQGKARRSLVQTSKCSRVASFHLQHSLSYTKGRGGRCRAAGSHRKRRSAAWAVFTCLHFLQRNDCRRAWFYHLSL